MLCIILFWIAVWQLAASAIRNDIIFAGPADVVRSLFALLPTADFREAVAMSFGKIILGFLTAFLLGILSGSLAFRFPALGELFAPLIMLIKSIPVASFVILALIWIGSENLSVLISFLVVFPMIYINTIAGLKSTDKKLLEMAQVFRVPWKRRLRMIYLPAIRPFLLAGSATALGMSWKAGVAAGVIGVVSGSIGERLYDAKIYLQNADLLAWTVVIVAMSAGFEWLMLRLLRRVFRTLGGDAAC